MDYRDAEMMYDGPIPRHILGRSQPRPDDPYSLEYGRTVKNLLAGVIAARTVSIAKLTEERASFEALKVGQMIQDAAGFGYVTPGYRNDWIKRLSERLADAEGDLAAARTALAAIEPVAAGVAQ